MLKNKYIIVFIAALILVFLSSCSAGHFVQKSEKFKQKAISKGAKYETVYKYVTKTDTLVDTLNNTVEIRTFVVDSVPYSVDVPVYVPVGRQERKRLKDSLRFAYRDHKLVVNALKDSLVQERKKHNATKKTERTVVRQENKSRWLMWLVIGIVIGLVIPMVIKIVVKYLKSYLLK